jgi:LysR family transcriptional regulator, pca operon transcriptional activator
MPKLPSKGPRPRPASLLQPRQLEAIIAVARTGSVHAAARSLGMPQPGLSRMVSASEELLGIELFERSPAGSRITERGGRVLRQAAFALRALSDVSQNARESVPVVKLGCIPRVMHVLLPRLLAQISDGEASFRLRVSVGTSNEMAAQLEAAQLDFVIARRAASARGEVDIQAETLYSEKTVVVCGRQREGLPGTALTLPKLAQLPWVIPRRGFYSRDSLDALFAAAGLPTIVPVIECDSFESNLSVVAATQFITLAPEFAARRVERLRLVRILRTRPLLAASPVMLQYRRGQEKHPVFPAFRAAAIRAARLVGRDPR